MACHKGIHKMEGKGRCKECARLRNIRWRHANRDRVRFLEKRRREKGRPTRARKGVFVFGTFKYNSIDEIKQLVKNYTDEYGGKVIGYRYTEQYEETLTFYFKEEHAKHDGKIPDCRTHHKYFEPIIERPLT